MRIIHDHCRTPANPNSEIRSPKSRRGVTLVEVLVSMFLLAIGLMGILALFPMGALQMAQAVKDERTAQTAKIMEGHAKILWRQAWLNAAGPNAGELNDETNAANTGVLDVNPELIALDNTDPLLYAANPALRVAYLRGPTPPSTYPTDRISNSPSSPVLIDPIGFAFQPAGNQRNWVGGVSGVLPRRSFTLIASLPVAGGLQNRARIRLCSLMDDLTFDTNGLPTAALRRAGDYNAAWLIQRPKNNVRTEINVQVIVYRKRPPTDTSSPETAITLTNSVLAYASPATHQLSNVALIAGVPAPKAGTWLLLAGPQGATQEAYADFYRVVSVTQTAANAYTFEFAQNIRSHSSVPGGPYSGTLIQMENIAEVFDKGTLSINDRPTQ
jgi:prepilin-type N-terminal cleavage/methylation domain-containing protein